jgi:predicted Fe-S protein YdhL (DUF1289 family)
MVVAVACKKICKLDEDKRYCIGCGRTIEEIIQKGKKVLDKIPNR